MTAFSLGSVPGRTQHVLVVAPHPGPVERLSIVLASGGLEVVRVSTPDAALAHVEDTRTDLVVIDDALQDLGGSTLCGQLREQAFEGGVVVLGAGPDEMAIVTVLDLGADDYVAQSCSVGELLARVRAVLRRVDRAPRARPLVVADSLHVDPDGHVIRFGRVDIATSGREYDLLALLAARRGRVVTQEEIMHAVWGAEWSGSRMVLGAAVTRLRTRLAAAGAPDVIENIRGVGFRLR